MCECVCSCRIAYTERAANETVSGICIELYSCSCICHGIKCYCNDAFEMNVYYSMSLCKHANKIVKPRLHGWEICTNRRMFIAVYNSYINYFRMSVVGLQTFRFIIHGTSFASGNTKIFIRLKLHWNSNNYCSSSWRKITPTKGSSVNRKVATTESNIHAQVFRSFAADPNSWKHIFIIIGGGCRPRHRHTTAKYTSMCSFALMHPSQPCIVALFCCLTLRFQ